MRTQSVTEKIDREVTSLAGAIYVHADMAPDGRVLSFRFSHRGKDDSTLDKVLTALGDVCTSILTSREVS